MTPTQDYEERLQNLRDKLAVASANYVRFLNAPDIDTVNMPLAAQGFYRALARYIALKLEEEPHAEV